MQKRIFLWMAFMMLFIGSASAARFWIADFEIAANETKTISINLDNTEDIYGYVLWLKLPEGVTIASDEYGYIVNPTSRFNNTPLVYFADGYYKITAATGGRPVSGTEGALLTFDVTASHLISTGTQAFGIEHQQITVNDADGAAKTVDQESSSYDCTTKVNVKTAASGFGTFSWPRSLDFTESGLEAYVGTEVKEGKLALQQITKVPAGTGIVVYGTPSTTFNPSVIEDGEAETSFVNVLLPTHEAPLAVTNGGYYALATKDSNGTAFYEVTPGVTIPQYEAYLYGASTGGSDAVTFDVTPSGIQEIAGEDAQGACYNLQGVRVTKMSKGGIYILNGKKIVVK